MPRFEDNIAAAVDALGVQPVGIIWGIAQTPWESDQERDQFLDLITRTRQAEG